MSESNRTLKRKRMVSYFINAAAELIETNGIDSVTVRNVAERAGYNSATLYNYFENFDHLIYLTALKIITPYTSNIGTYLHSCTNALERNLKCWEFFLKHSFQNPRIYEKIFFAQFDNASLEKYTEDYYDLFLPQDPDTPVSIRNMLSRQNFYERTRAILCDCIAEGFFLEEDQDEIVEMSIFLYKGLLSQLLEQKTASETDELVEKGMSYLKRCYKAFFISEPR